MRKAHTMENAVMRKIWIDLDNSPHVPFFKPIIAELEKRGYGITLTFRDCFQVKGLAELHSLPCYPVGKHYGKNKLLKIAGLLIRSMQMLPIVIREKPCVAISHGSRSQLLVSSVMGIPSIFLADYEYTQELVVVSPNWLIVPEVIPDSAFKLNKKRVIKYPGIKEDVYVPSFTGDPNFRNELGFNNDDLLVTVRPPATEAHYHNRKTEKIFEETINILGNKPNLRMVLLPRNDKQRKWIRRKWPEWVNNGQIFILEHVVDGLNLIWHSDFVISGGGTMNREAATLGVPVYSIFLGKIGSVDRHLAKKGRLVLLNSVGDLKDKIRIEANIRRGNLSNADPKALMKIVDEVENILGRCLIK